MRKFIVIFISIYPLRCILIYQLNWLNKVMNNKKETQYWEDIDKAKYYIIDPKYHTQSEVCLKNGTFRGKFNPKITGTAGILERK